jgi:hypothetical protein
MKKQILQAIASLTLSLALTSTGCLVAETGRQRVIERTGAGAAPLRRAR